MHQSPAVRCNALTSSTGTHCICLAKMVESGYTLLRKKWYVFYAALGVSPDQNDAMWAEFLLLVLLYWKVEQECTFCI